VHLVLWARPMIFGGKGKAEISGRAGYHFFVRWRMTQKRPIYELLPHRIYDVIYLWRH
jgi:hypothetical protein